MARGFSLPWQTEKRVSKREENRFLFPILGLRKLHFLPNLHSLETDRQTSGYLIRIGTPNSEK